MLSSRVVPSLLVRDMAETLSFYTETLGFQVTGSHPDETNRPTWAEVCRDGMTPWFFTDTPGPVTAAPALSGTLYFFPDDVATLANEWREKVPLEWEPNALDTGLREFAIRDCNDYLLAFTEPG